MVMVVGQRVSCQGHGDPGQNLRSQGHHQGHLGLKLELFWELVQVLVCQGLENFRLECTVLAWVDVVWWGLQGD